MERQFDKQHKRQLHLSPSDIKVSFISNILLTVVLCTTLKPNGKFSVYCFGWILLVEETKTLSRSRISVVWLFIILFICTQLCSVFK